MLEITEFSDSAQADRDMGGAPRPIAPAWHTVLMLLLVLAPLIQAIAYDRSHPGVPSQPPAAIPLYLIGAAVQCIFFSSRGGAFGCERILCAHWSARDGQAGDRSRAI